MSFLRSIFPELDGPGKGAHFIGIGGIGMSALARWFLARKIPVSGSDLARSPITEELAKDGVKVKIGHKKRQIAGAGLVVYSQAVKPDNPELEESRRLKVSALSYPEAVGRLTRHYKTVAVAGAHGKSTTTAIIALILRNAGFDPTVIIGTNLREFGGKNFRGGKSRWLVLEADEFGKSFLRYSPAVAVITNIDLEHLDTYKNLADIKRNFLKFLSNAENGGALILNKDNSPLFRERLKILKTAKSKKQRAVWYSLEQPAAKKVKKKIKIPGEHNVSNALAACAVGRELGIPEKKILSVIASYRGSWRRMEYRGRWRIVGGRWRKNKETDSHKPSAVRYAPVFDDYAHHPTEIRATLTAFREKYSRPSGRGSLSAARSPVVCVYQPHQALRLKKLWRGFVNAFSGADILVLIPVYQVAGRDKIDPRFTSETLAATIKRKYPEKQVFYLANPKNIKKFLARILPATRYLPPAVLVMMGAGDIVNYTSLLLRR